MRSSTEQTDANAFPRDRPPGSPPTAVEGLGLIVWANPFEAGSFEPLDASEGTRVIAWSGWQPGDPGEADGSFVGDFRTWGPAGRARLNELLDAAEPVLLARGLTLCLRPHARHALPDPQSVLSTLRSREPGPFEALLEPFALLTPEMMPAAEDHTARAFEALGDRPDVPAVVLPERWSEGRGQKVVPSHLLDTLRRNAGSTGKPVYIMR